MIKMVHCFMLKMWNQLVIGQAVLRNTFVTTFPGFYYDDQFLVDQTTAAGLHIDKIEKMFILRRDE